MNEYFPGKKRFAHLNTELKGPRGWASNALDLTTKVVCESCNNGWMSDIESQHAKPSIGPLLEGKVDIPITQSHARSIALFAFKTAVICDHMRRGDRFFPRATRYLFKEKSEIPATVQMWFAGYLGRSEGASLTIYHNVPDPNGFQLYVCTYLIGYFVFQVLATSMPTSWFVRPHETTFKNLAVPFWPSVPGSFMWPPKTVLMKATEFQKFAGRWKFIDAFSIAGR